MQLSTGNSASKRRQRLTRILRGVLAALLIPIYAQGLASGPVTSFSQAAVQVILNMPEHMTPEMFICVGHAALKKQQGMKAGRKTTWQDLTYWERFE